MGYESAAQFSEGSPGRALDFIRRRDEYLSPAVARFFAREETAEQEILETLSELRDVPTATVVRTLLLLYRQALRAKLTAASSRDAFEPSAVRVGDRASLDYLRRAVKYLEGRTRDCEMRLNRQLFLYTLLASLRTARRR